MIELKEGRRILLYLNVVVGLIVNVSNAYSSEEFLNSVINQLKQNQLSSVESGVFYNDYSNDHQHSADNEQRSINEKDGSNNFANDVTPNNINNANSYEHGQHKDEVENYGFLSGTNNFFQQNDGGADNSGGVLYSDNAQYIKNENSNLPLAAATNLQQENNNVFNHANNNEALNNVDAGGAALNVNEHDYSFNNFYPNYPTMDDFQNANHLIDNIMPAAEGDFQAVQQNGSNGEAEQTGTKSKPVEPLFVAMAGFISITMIFMSAMIFLPKLLTSQQDVANLKKAPEQIADLTKLAFDAAVDGNDCTERIACEIGTAFRSLNLQSQPIRIMEIILPINMSKQLAQIRKALISKQKCKLILCKPSSMKDKKPTSKI